MEPIADVTARLKAAAAEHADTYVTVAGEDLGRLIAEPGVPKADRAAFTPVVKAAGKTSAGTVDLHRTKHLEPLLKAAEAQPAAG